MRVEELPASIIILGGGFIAAEFAHVLSGFGVEVTIINRSNQLLRRADQDISARFTDLAARRWRCALGENITRIESSDDARVRVHTDTAVYSADALLVAMGRSPNSAGLNLTAAGVQVDDGGYVRVDAQQRTTADGIWAVGDICSRWQLKHVANAEGRTVQHNLLHPTELRATDHRFVPAAIFSHPQIAQVGLTEAQAQDRGHDLVIAIQNYGDVAYGWAMADDEHFVKLIADRASGKLLGAHIIGPQASTLIQPLIQGLSFDTPINELARGQYWIHPALTEVVENALLQLVAKL